MFIIEPDSATPNVIHFRPIGFRSHVFLSYSFSLLYVLFFIKNFSWYNFSIYFSDSCVYIPIIFLNIGISVMAILNKRNENKMTSSITL